MRRWSLWVIALAIVAVAGAARADPSGARELYAAGTQAFESGQYRLALRAYEEAYRLDPRPETAFSVAQAARLLFFELRDPSLIERALELYRVYLTQVPTGRRRAHAVQHVAALEALRALAPAAEPRAAEPAETIIMVVSRTPGARASVGGGTAQRVPMARSVAPGDHRIVVTAPGYLPATLDWPALEGRLVVAPVELQPRPARLGVVAPEGAVIAVDGRIVGVAPLAPLEVAHGRHEVAVGAPGSAAARRVVTLDPGETATVTLDELSTTHGRVAAYWLLGASGGLAVAGAIASALSLAAEQRALAFEARVGQAPLTPEAGADYLDDVRLRDQARDAGLGLFGIAAATVAGGLVVWLVDAAGTADPTRPGAGVRPWLAPGNIGLVWRAEL